MYSDTADAFYLLGLDASLASVSKRAVAALILVRHSLVRIALVCAAALRKPRESTAVYQHERLPSCRGAGMVFHSLPVVSALAYGSVSKP